MFSICLRCLWHLIHVALKVPFGRKWATDCLTCCLFQFWYCRCIFVFLEAVVLVDHRSVFLWRFLCIIHILYSNCSVSEIVHLLNCETDKCYKSSEIEERLKAELININICLCLITLKVILPWIKKVFFRLGLRDCQWPLLCKMCSLVWLALPLAYVNIMSWD